MLTTRRKYNTQPNIITNSNDDMSLIEKRIIYLAINKMETKINVDPNFFINLDFEIPIVDLGDTNYDRVRTAVLKLQSRNLTLIDDRTKKEVERITPFPRVKIKNGILKLQMLAGVVPHFLELKKGFTKYELAAALSLTSVYSQKLYEHFSRWKDKEKWSIALDELKILLNAENYRYPQFRQKCLDIAVKEINEKTDLTTSYDVTKTGKAVSSIEFKIIRKAKKELEEARLGFDQDLYALTVMRPSEVSVHVKHMLHDYTFTKQQQELILSTTVLFNKFVELDLKLRNGVITAKTTPTAYLASVLFKKPK